LREPYTHLYVHLVWATWDRLPLITPEIEAIVYGCIRRDCEKVKAEVLALNGVEDHVHLLARLPTTLTIADLAKQVKGSSSHLTANKMGHEPFRWQGGYGAFTVSKKHVEAVRQYVECQKEHHANGSLHREWEATHL
jgi:putative transposase